MEPEVLDRLESQHVAVTVMIGDPAYGGGPAEECRHCETLWPCDVRILLDWAKELKPADG